ncbi:hypothetical protein H8A97_13035 [Bradyrhizobium sp. Arg62]|uniref:hypothetical protein n=1 Tax=Bradyrhizobium brasilense TaxID=1419277 RepID=UPI001E555409|nr:hypothetical protein [Bradyrhizobium brasilense]MCC8945998.1 hypothetical protein [Bradyrhizobium brasilense]
MVDRSLWIGWDPNPKEIAAFAVAKVSARRALGPYIPIRGLMLGELKRLGLYTRQLEIRHTVDGPEMWDVISQARQSTEHANSRFLVPTIAERGWALFSDADVLFRRPLNTTFESLDRSKAVYCVKHDYRPKTTKKMEGAAQTQYFRKNWSSVCFYNCDHPSNRKLTVELFNKTPGRDLHRFCWLEDDEIGELPPSFNFLVGHHSTKQVPDPHIVHFTEGTPNMAGYEDSPFAEEWWGELNRWAA